MGELNIIKVDGELTKPANTLIKRISAAIGTLYQPTHIVRLAKAQAKADMIEAHSRVQITEVQERGIIRLATEEGFKQQNIENIITLAIPLLDAESKPEEIEEDWLPYFFDRSKLTSDEEMQSLWAKILAGEANQAGSFSKNTIDIVSKLSKKDARLFTNLCSMCWHLEEPTPLVIGAHKIYKEKSLDFSNLSHLKSIGLVTYDALGGIKLNEFPRHVTAIYFDKCVDLEFNQKNPEMLIGSCILTEAGKELSRICKAEYSDEFFDYIVSYWISMRHSPSTPLPPVEIKKFIL